MCASLTPLTGQSLGGRPVTETVMLVNMGNQPHCDNGEGLASCLPLTRFVWNPIPDPGFRFAPPWAVQYRAFSAWHFDWYF